MGERISFRNEMDKLLADEPFIPFEIVMASGDRYRVDNPNLVALARDTIGIAFGSRHTYSVLRFNQVSSIDVLESSDS